jgi:hypothetical protein
MGIDPVRVGGMPGLAVTAATGVTR